MITSDDATRNAINLISIQWAIIRKNNQSLDVTARGAIEEEKLICAGQIEISKCTDAQKIAATTDKRSVAIKPNQITFNNVNN